MAVPVKYKPHSGGSIPSTHTKVKGDNFTTLPFNLLHMYAEHTHTHTHIIFFSGKHIKVGFQWENNFQVASIVKNYEMLQETKDCFSMLRNKSWKALCLKHWHE